MDNLLQSVAAFVTEHQSWAGLILGALTFAESLVLIGAFVPATALMLLAGTLIGGGVLDPFEVLLWCTIGAVLGDAVSYALGRRLGPRVLRIPAFRDHRRTIARTRLFNRPLPLTFGNRLSHRIGGRLPLEEALTHVDAMARQTLALCEELLQVMRAETRALTLGDSDLVALAEEAIGEMQLQARAKDIALIGDMSEESWRRTIDGYLTSVFLCLRHQIPAMLPTGRGVIVNMSSIYGLRGHAIPGGGAYAAAKHGVLGLTRSAALQYASKGLRITAISPGWVATPPIAGWMKNDPAFASTITGLTPRGKVATPEEIAQSVLFLCSDGAAAIVLADVETALKLDKAIAFRSTAHVSDFLPMSKRDILKFEGCAEAWKRALSDAGIALGDLSLVETHDCFTVAELIEYEAMGLVPEGQGFRAIKEGWTQKDGKLPVNPSGGLKAKGHPIGATGVSMHALCAMQLSATAGDIQVKDAKLAGIFNMGGAAVANYVSILERIK
mgnify:CR=1 FL=1